MARNIPAAEIDVTTELVRGLLAEQHPDLVDRPLELVANGWDNAIFRLGTDLAVRLPRRQLGADLVAHEQEWLPRLAGRLPLPVPSPVRTGGPGGGYPWAWSVTPWFDGEVAADVTLVDPAGDAEILGAFVRELHATRANGAPLNQFRAMPVADLDERIEANTRELRGSPALGDWITVDRIRERWRELRDGTVEWPGAPVLVHGDLHTANMLASAGRLSAVLDFGDITAGDPAVDLAVAWMLFEAPERQRFRTAVGGVDDHTWQRAAAWGVHFAVLYLLHSADEPRFGRMGRRLMTALTVSDTASPFALHLPQPEAIDVKRV